MQYSFMVMLFALSAIVCFACMGYIRKHLRVLATNSVTLVLLCMGVWAATSAVDNVIVGLEKKLFVTNLAYLAYSLLIPSWILFMAEYATRRQQTRNPLIITLFVISSVFVLLNWINPGNLFYTEIATVVVNGQEVFDPTYGPLFYTYTIYSYGILFCTTIWLLVMARRSEIQTRHLVLMLTATYFPIVCNVPYVLGLFVYDITGIGFIVSCGLLMLLYRNEFFAEMPLARHQILDAMSDGFVLLDRHNKVTEMNHAALKMLGLTEEAVPSDKATEIIATWPIHVEKEYIRFVQAYDLPGQGQRFYRVSINKIDANKKGVMNYLLVLQDETTLHNVQERVHFLECYDEATGLYNRQYFMQLLEQELERCQLLPQSIALVCASILNYRDYCYIYGNEFGTKISQHIGRQIKDLLRRNDAISCFSDNEFFFYLRFESVTDITERVDSAMKRIADQVSKPFEIDGVTLEIRLRAGISLCPKHTMNSGKLISMAHMACRGISKLVSRSYSIYQESGGYDYQHTLQLEQGLHKAIANEELYLMYQPQIDLRDQRVIGVEALLRWNHPELGLIPPTDFIPIAEENGLIHSIGLWVIGEVVRQMEKWQAMGQTSLRVSANVSLSQLTNDLFADQVIELLGRAKIDPRNLELEITESLALFPEALTYGHLQRLRERGIRVAMDDFGMGHSSLSYIKQFDLDTIKIDRILSSDILNDQVSVAMMKSVKMLCETIGIDMVVEYIEHPDQLKVLEELGCYIVQGYVFSPPLLVDACTNYIMLANT